MSTIGILGGTFDPPHIGHVMIAKEVQRACGLDEIWFIPTNEPPHKQQAVALPNERLAMLEELVKEEPTWKVKDIELKRAGKSYTVDTIASLSEMYPVHEFHFIIGADMVQYLPKWERIDELRKRVTFIRVHRPGYTNDSPFPIKEVPVPAIDLSSTMIRERLRENQSADDALPKGVHTYIKEHQLYGYRTDQGKSTGATE